MYVYPHVWAACSAVACADSLNALKMCDLSAHAYRTSYVDICQYPHVWAACSVVACVDSRIAINVCDLSAHAYRTSYVDVCISTCMGCLFGCSVCRLAYRTKNVLFVCTRL